jgi:hypothetical protein
MLTRRGGDASTSFSQARALSALAMCTPSSISAGRVLTVANRDIVVLGGANTDYLVRGRELRVPGVTLNGSEFLEAPGGKGANQAVVAVRLGARTALVASVGRDRRGWP